jgi:periplasmic protein CpxP/Spy
MRLTQLMGLMIVAIAVGISIPYLPKPSFLLAQTTDSGPEKDAAEGKTEKGVQERSIPSRTDDVEASESPPMMGQPGVLLRSLKLSVDQKRKLQAVRQDVQPRIREGRLKVRTAQAELDEMLVGTASDTALKAKFRQVSQLRQEVQQLQFESVLAMRQVLTPDQRQQFAQAMEKRRELRQQQRQNRQQNPVKEKE